MDSKILAEAEALIYGVQTISTERADEIEDSEYGTPVRNIDEGNDQRILEMQLVIASKGWGYIVELWQKLVAEAEKDMKSPDLSDEQTVSKKRDWLALQKAVSKILIAVHSAARTPLSTDLPR
jgi:hypothetical protein